MFNSSHLKKKKKKDSFAGRSKGKTNVIHGKKGDRAKISNQPEIYNSSFQCWIRKYGREKLQSKEKTFLGNGKIKTEVDM